MAPLASSHTLLSRILVYKLQLSYVISYLYFVVRTSLNYGEEITACQEKLPSKQRKPLHCCTALNLLVPCKSSLYFRPGFDLSRRHSEDLR